MLVYVDTPRAVTFRSFRDTTEAADFANRQAKNIVSIRKVSGRIIVRYRAKSPVKVWSQNREEKAVKRPTYKLAPENWPAKYR